MSKIPLERHQTGINFSLYREKTINCRIPGRLALHRITGLWDYGERLQIDPDEQQRTNRFLERMAEDWKVITANRS